MMGLTQQQAKCFQLISDALSSGKVAPNYDELARGLGLKSRGNIVRIVNALIDRGAVTKIPGRRRSLAIVNPMIQVDPIPEVRKAIRDYADQNHISESTAVAEACRAYFTEAA